MQDFRAVGTVGEVDAFPFHAGAGKGCRLSRLRQSGQFKKRFQTFHRSLDLPHIFREDFQLGQRPHHGHGQHDCQHKL